MTPSNSLFDFLKLFKKSVRCLIARKLNYGNIMLFMAKSYV